MKCHAVEQNGKLLFYLHITEFLPLKLVYLFIFFFICNKDMLLIAVEKHTELLCLLSELPKTWPRVTNYFQG